MLGYFRSRFPVLPLFLYTFLTSGAIAARFGKFSWYAVLTVAFLYLQFLFHLRVLDEFKDFKYDSENHTDRPVQNGQISLSTLLRLGTANFLIMLYIVNTIATRSVTIIFFIGLVYTCFMFVEFFLGAWFRKRIGLYMVSHQIVFVPVFLSFYGIFARGLWYPERMSDLAHFLYLILPIAILEIGRKLAPRYSATGEETDDTYTANWGEKRSVEVYCLLILGACACGVVSMSSVSKFILTVLFSIIGLGVSFVALWKYKLVVKYGMAVTVIVVLSLPFLGNI